MGALFDVGASAEGGRVLVRASFSRERARYVAALLVSCPIDWAQDLGRSIAVAALPFGEEEAPSEVRQVRTLRLVR